MKTTDTLTYDFSNKVLQKWTTNRLTVEAVDTNLNVIFNIVGSTCSNMGWPIIFSIKMELKKEIDDYRINKAYLQFSDDQGYKKMCYFQTTDSSNELLETAPFDQGDLLASTILKIQKQPPAGCLCTQKGRKYFWNIALQSTLYYLNNTNI